MLVRSPDQTLEKLARSTAPPFSNPSRRIPAMMVLSGFLLHSQPRGSGFWILKHFHLRASDTFMKPTNITCTTDMAGVSSSSSSSPSSSSSSSSSLFFSFSFPSFSSSPPLQGFASTTPGPD